MLITSKRIVLIMFASLAALIFLEIGLRLIWLPPDLDTHYQRRDLTWMQENVNLNSFGYRDQEFSLEKDSDTFRIYSLGDSYTFGWYINDHQKTYPQLLEKALKEKFNEEVEVINAASPGFSLEEEVKRFETEGLLFHPDLVTIGLNYNEFNLSNRSYWPYRPPLSLLWQSRLYQSTFHKLFQKIAFRKNYQVYQDLFTNPGSADWQEFEKIILSLKKEAAKINAGLVIILFPHIDPRDPYQKYPFPAMHEKVAQFCQENEIFFVDPLPLYFEQTQKEALVVNPLDLHPSELANQLVSQAFLEQFDFSRYLENHQSYPPQIKKVKIASSRDSLGPYLKIRKITSRQSDLPWVYFETKYENDVQKFPLTDRQQRQTTINIDHLQTAKTFTHEGIIGGSLEYHVLAENQKPGEILIPRTLYGYSVIGPELVQGFYTTEKGATVSEYLKPLKIEKLKDFLKITFKPHFPYYLYSLNLAVAVKQLDINPDGSIANIIQTKLLIKKVDQETAVLTFPVSEEVSGLTVFLEDPQISYSYAFVNNILTRLKWLTVVGNQLELTFDHKLQINDEVFLPIATAYQIRGEEFLIIEIE